MQPKNPGNGTFFFVLISTRRDTSTGVSVSPRAQLEAHRTPHLARADVAFPRCHCFRLLLLLLRAVARLRLRLPLAPSFPLCARVCVRDSVCVCVSVCVSVCVLPLLRPPSPFRSNNGGHRDRQQIRGAPAPAAVHPARPGVRLLHQGNAADRRSGAFLRGVRVLRRVHGSGLRDSPTAGVPGRPLPALRLLYQVQRALQGLSVAAHGFHEVRDGFHHLFRHLHYRCVQVRGRSLAGRRGVRVHRHHRVRR